MDDAKNQEGFARIEGLIDNLASLRAREFKNISDRFTGIYERVSNVDEHFTAIDERLVTIEARIESFGRRVDYEAEERHALTGRVSKLEKAA